MYSFISKMQRKVLQYKHISISFLRSTPFPELKTHVLLYCAVKPQSEQLQKHIRNADHSKVKFKIGCGREGGR